jgi:ADP-heptose:LPS heptosyltransferase
VKILYCKCFGLGNAVQAIPAIKALQQTYGSDNVDILVGNLPDDVGALNVLNHMAIGGGKICVNSAIERHYDVAVCAIPYDGRWKNGAHFFADKVVDGRTRPDPKTTGLVSWKYHESEYQMDNARLLGFYGKTPSCQFLPFVDKDPDLIYLGIGYKKDSSNFWSVKHWGNANYAALVKMILSEYPNKRVVTSGDMLDLKLSISQISSLVRDKNRFSFYAPCRIPDMFNLISKCSAYVGNDTGTMHVASSCGLDVLSMFFLDNSFIKSSPLRVNEKQKIKKLYGAGAFRSIMTPQRIMEKLREILT